MSFDPTTFILEIVNFLVLIWILQRLFYRPLLNIIAQRKRFIDQTLADAEAVRRDAEQQRNQYENRQQLWQQEKQAALAALQQQLNAERAEQMARFSASLEQERQKARVMLEREQQERQRQAEKQALANGARFAALLLSHAGGPELEARLFEMLLAQLTVLPEACRLCLQTLESQKKPVIHIASGFPLSAEQRQRLEQRLAAHFAAPVSYHYHQDSALIAGFRLDIGAWVLNANVQHELTGFAELAYGHD